MVDLERLRRCRNPIIAERNTSLIVDAAEEIDRLRQREEEHMMALAYIANQADDEGIRKLATLALNAGPKEK